MRGKIITLLISSAATISKSVIEDQLEASSIPDLSNQELASIKEEATDDEVLRTNAKSQNET